jgi:ferrochelatase
LRRKGPFREFIEASSASVSAIPPRIGVLLVNTGTPASPSSGDVRRFLSRFLSDPRVVELPQALWLPILHGVILRTRPGASAKKYRKIWTPEGSPLFVLSVALRAALVERLSGGPEPPLIELGMLYSDPGVREGLDKLRDGGADRILVLPLYPQYSGASTGAAFDALAQALTRARVVPDLRFISGYSARADFVDAWRVSIANFWQANGRTQHLLLSFHGVPQSMIDRGDVYLSQCQTTASQLAAALELGAEEWSVSFQSRVGVARWLQPYTFEVMDRLPKNGITDLTVACPGFAVDCLETLEEIDIENRRRFLRAGGKRFLYVPALNAAAPHVELLASLIREQTNGWTASITR